MKKVLLITLMFVLSLNGFSQINRTIWGCTLGISTKQQVRTVLESRGYNVLIEPDGSLAVKTNNFNFGGSFWTYVSFCFVNNLLSQVWFQNNENQSIVKINDTYEKVKLSLDKKYRIYYFKLSDMDGYVDNSNYTDKRTTIHLGLFTYNNIRYVHLSYEDDFLQEKKSQQEEDEL